MEIRETGIAGLLVIKPKIFEDERGYFFESFNESDLDKAGHPFHFIQDNQSKSLYGVVRGLHYQLEPKAQTKFVRVLEGSICDVAVDLRKNSPTFLQWKGIELSADNKLQMLIPKGFAHGFSVLSDAAVVLYKCDEFYAPDLETGIRYDDPEIGIDWKVEPEDRILSGRDLAMPSLHEASMNFQY
ncbi:MAG: dTDP-4-dehydrorhamnose 3,5-epimerase [Bacteroidales bacterium]